MFTESVLLMHRVMAHAGRKGDSDTFGPRSRVPHYGLGAHCPLC